MGTKLCLSKTKVDIVSYNLIQSVLKFIFIVCCCPLAFLLQYIRTHDNENAHVSSIDDAFANILHGCQCLMGTVDVCNANVIFEYPIIQFCILLLLMCANRISLSQLMQNKIYIKYVINKNAFIQHLLSMSMVLAFLLCYVTKVQNLWNRGTQLILDWETILIATLLLIGSLFTYRQIDQRTVSIKPMEEDWIINEK